MRDKKFPGVFASTLLILSTHVNGALIEYKSFEDWEDEAENVGSISHDAFEYSIANEINTPITLNSEIKSTGNDDGTPAGQNLVDFVEEEPVDEYVGRVGGSNQSSAYSSITWEFPTEILGFFGDFSRVEGLSVTVAGFTFTIGGDDDTPVPATFGIISDNVDTQFTLLTWLPNTAQSSQFKIDDFYFVTADSTPPPTVPAPATLWLFGTALLGLIGFRKRIVVNSV